MISQQCCNVRIDPLLLLTCCLSLAFYRRFSVVFHVVLCYFVALCAVVDIPLLTPCVVRLIVQYVNNDRRQCCSASACSYFITLPIYMFPNHNVVVTSQTENGEIENITSKCKYKHTTRQYQDSIVTACGSLAISTVFPHMCMFILFRIYFVNCRCIDMYNKNINDFYS